MRTDNNYENFITTNQDYHPDGYIPPSLPLTISGQFSNMFEILLDISGSKNNTLYFKEYGINSKGKTALLSVTKKRDSRYSDVDFHRYKGFRHYLFTYVLNGKESNYYATSEDQNSVWLGGIFEILRV